jgi:hypothetical protein
MAAQKNELSPQKKHWEKRMRRIRRGCFREHPIENTAIIALLACAARHGAGMRPGLGQGNRQVLSGVNVKPAERIA